MRRFCPDTAIRRESCKDRFESIHRRKAETLPDKYRFRTGTASRKCTSGRKRVLPGAENLNPTTKASAIGKRIQMIARQTQEVFADCHDGDTNIRVSTWIEKLLAVKDNLEYGIVSSERTTNRWAYMDEKLLMMDFRTALAQNLYQLNVLPMEANGTIFDPHIHDAVHIEETDLVEEDRVVEEIQKGYFFGEKLYRPTKVIVSKNSCQK